MTSRRLTIRNVMILIAVVAVVLAIGQTYSYLLLVVLTWLLAPVVLGYLAWRVGLTSPVLALASLVVLAVPASLATAWLCVYPMEEDSSMPFIAAWTTSPILAGFALGWIMEGWRRAGLEGTPFRLLAVSTVAALPFTMALSYWPLHIAFAFARPEMLRLIDQVASGNPVQFPHQAGIYQVLTVRIDPEQPKNCAVIVGNNPNSHIGFVRIDEPTNEFQNLAVSPSNYRVDFGDGWSFFR